MRLIRGKVVEFLFVMAGFVLIMIAKGWMFQLAMPLGIALMILGTLAFLTGHFGWTELDSYQRVRGAYVLWWKAQSEKSPEVRAMLIMDSYASLDSIVPFTIPEELVRRASVKELLFLDRYVTDRVQGYLSRGNVLYWLKNGIDRRFGKEYERRREQREFYF